MKLDTYCVPRSLIISSSRLWSSIQGLWTAGLLQRVTSDVVGMTWVCLARWSTTTRMVAYPWLCGNTIIRWTEMICQQQSGTQLGMSFPLEVPGRSWCGYRDHILSCILSHNVPSQATRSCEWLILFSSIGWVGWLWGNHGGPSICHSRAGYLGGHIPSLYRALVCPLHGIPQCPVHTWCQVP